ncbi:MAG: DUF72 domain-containing protein [Promethearchaeia archaeon]
MSNSRKNDINDSNILIGTSGWGYDEWVGPFYPKGLKSKDFLHYYSQIFYTNEINTTFYQIPSHRLVRGWATRTPSNFVFSAKLPRVVTHKHKLNIDACIEDLEYYLMSMDPLIQANKLIAFLIQLPPSFTKEEHFSNLKDFIENWPEDYQEARYNLVVEFRHKSWMNQEVFDYLRNNALTYCSVIEPLLPPRMNVTNKEFAYIRFHGYGENIWFNYLFSEEEIKKWSNKVIQVVREAEKIGIYFNNHFSGYAAKNSFMMMKELEIQPRNYPRDVNILEIKKRSGTISEGQTGLDKFL